MEKRAVVGVLVSGSGSNLQALIDAARDPAYPARIAVVLSNVADAYGLERARAAGIPALALSHRDGGAAPGASPDEQRRAYDARLVELLRQHGVEWVCLAGFMRLVTPVFLDAFPHRVLNIHPALLPAFPGTHGHQQAIDGCVRIAGATVHFVDAGTDTGPIIAQGAVPVLPGDDAERLRDRLLPVEHRLYPMALRWAVTGQVSVVEGRTRYDLAPGEVPAVWGG